MTRVFLSYGAEDGAVAKRLVGWLEGRGVELFWFQNEEQRGRRFVDEIERGNHEQKPSRHGWLSSLRRRVRP